MAGRGLPGAAEHGPLGHAAAAGVAEAAPGVWGKGVVGTLGLEHLQAGRKGGSALRTPSVKQSRRLISFQVIGFRIRKVQAERRLWASPCPAAVPCFCSFQAHFSCTPQKAFPNSDLSIVSPNKNITNFLCILSANNAILFLKPHCW